MKFEDKMKKLEDTINELENGEIDLDSSIKKYTEAMKLVKECDDELNKIEKEEYKIVLENGEEKDFKIEDEEK